MIHEPNIITRENRKYFEPMKAKNTIYQNLWEIVKTILRKNLQLQMDIVGMKAKK